MTEFGDGDRNGEPSEKDWGCLAMVGLLLLAALATVLILVLQNGLGGA